MAAAAQLVTLSQRSSSRGGDITVLLQNGLSEEGHRILPVTFVSTLMTAVFYKQSNKPASWHILYGRVRAGQIYRGVNDVFQTILGEYFFMLTAPSYKDPLFASHLQEYIRQRLDYYLSVRAHLPRFRVRAANILLCNNDNLTIAREWDATTLSTNQLGMYFSFKPPRDGGLVTPGWVCYILLEFVGTWRKVCLDQYNLFFPQVSSLMPPPVPVGHSVYRLSPGLRQIVQTLPGTNPMRCTFTEAEVERRQRGVSW
jgi:hypothetical protein